MEGTGATPTFGYPSRPNAQIGSGKGSSKRPEGADAEVAVCATSRSVFFLPKPLRTRPNPLVGLYPRKHDLLFSYSLDSPTSSRMAEGDPELQWLTELSTEGRLCATDARKEYSIPDSVLKPLPCERRINPHYTSAAPMRLYHREDILPAATAFHIRKRAADEERASK